MAVIAKTARINGIALSLSEAQNHANKGSVGVVDQYLEEVRKYAKEADITITKEQNAKMAVIAKTARVNGIALSLSNARNHANKGSVGVVNQYLEEVRKYAKEADIPITKEREAEMAGITKTARINLIDSRLSIASKYAKESSVKDVWDFHNLAREEAKEYGIPLTKEQKERMLQTKIIAITSLIPRFFGIDINKPPRANFVR